MDFCLVDELTSTLHDICGLFENPGQLSCSCICSVGLFIEKDYICSIAQGDRGELMRVISNPNAFGEDQALASTTFRHY